MQRLLRAPRPTLRRLVLIAAMAAVVATTAGPAAHPMPANASTASTMESELLGWINGARANRGLAPLRLISSLTSFAESRAATMASTGVLAHPSCLSCALTSAGVPWYTNAEDIGWTNYPWGDQAAQTIFNSWKGSSGHWAILMSSTYNYIWLGVAYRSSNSSTFAAADLTESRDMTRPWAKMGGVSRSGSTVYWSWSGND